jgi:hypothetical protein
MVRIKRAGMNPDNSRNCRWFFTQAGHRVKGVLQAIPCSEATVGQAGGHTSFGRGVFALDEDIDGQIEGEGRFSQEMDMACLAHS